MRWFFARDREEHGEDTEALRLQAERARMLVEESREMLLVLDAKNRVIAASRRAREGLDGVAEGRPAPRELLEGDGRHEPLLVPYHVDGREETLLYLSPPGELAAYEELRAGFTAAVSHELRTPLARILALLETAALPGEDPAALADQARGEVELIGELIDDILFLSELETGRAVVALGETRALPFVSEVLGKLGETATRAGVKLRAEGDPDATLPLRPRMLRVLTENLAQNAIRYAGPGSTFTVTVAPGELRAADDGAGVAEGDLPRLFERFFRADRVRGSRGTGLGLAVVKHIVAAANGTVEASQTPGHGLTITCRFSPG
ncbi:MAG TPA: HAMP domain-containing sensor histidine kinase [Gaiellaceae bacterium]|jgi:two-component system phosphate regulon sensor histidine kinase PhoR|nr:HAMP domain-containing sensor histidine kinase [Gaiellaceae bacterium]